MRRTKIICTLGLASQTPEVIEQLMGAGMNVARFNFSHGTHASHKKMFDIVCAVREKLDIPVATLLDTKGPEIRLGEIEGGRATLEEGGEFVLTARPVMGDSTKASISHQGLAGDVAPGCRLLIDDGLIELRVTRVEGADIVCKVLNGGDISNRKGVNVPGVALSMPYISDQDRKDIEFGLKTGFDFIAASFVRNAADIMEIRGILNEHESNDTLVIAKIESADGVKNIDEILRVSDGIMVARGDMGVEIPFEELPALQKLLIEKAYNAGKIVITATQMLESMIKSPRPTRAEATDVANAIYDGTSAVMLSGETAAGLYPVKAAETMARIAERTEADINYQKRFQSKEYTPENASVTNAISHATCTTAYDLRAKAIIAVTMSGTTARRISKYRPDMPIIGSTTSPKTYRQMSMSWGVIPLMLQEQDDLNQLFSHAVGSARNNGIVDNGDVVVITTGVPLGVSGTTNLIKVHIAGDVLIFGKGVNTLTACGNVCVAHSDEEALKYFRPGDILVMKKTSNNVLSLLKSASAIITEEEGTNSHAAVVGLVLDIPVIVGAEHATNILKSGTIVTVDAEQGIVSNTSAC